jgi:hypothetical protein
MATAAAVNQSELLPEVGDGLMGKAAYRGGVQRLHFSTRVDL